MDKEDFTTEKIDLIMIEANARVNFEFVLDELLKKLSPEGFKEKEKKLIEQCFNSWYKF